MQNKTHHFGIYLIIFLLANFIALAIGGFAQSGGPNSDWYLNLNRAPWTPPGWMFGFAWTIIMICFAVYLAFLAQTIALSKFFGIYMAQWVLNVLWNPIFFAWHQLGLALVVLILLTLTVAYFMFRYLKQLKLKSLFILPYFVWLIIAISLNAYVLLMN